MENRAFTLIELLVVVLIIGILAAIAVPQYQLAVNKSRSSEALTMLKAIMQAQEVYYLANGRYSTSLENLDIKIPSDQITTWVGVDESRPNTYMYSCHGTRGDACMARAANSSKLPLFQVNFIHGQQNGPGKILCSGFGTTSAAAKICQSMSSVSHVEANGYTYYELN